MFTSINVASAADTWSSNTTVINGLGDIGMASSPEAFYNLFGDGKWHLITGGLDTLTGFEWNGTGWESNSTVISGIGLQGRGRPVVFYNFFGDETWHLILGEDDGAFFGYKWSGSSWVSNSTIISGLGDIGEKSSSSVFYNLFGDEKWHLIAGEEDGNFNGYQWTGSAWSSNATVISGLTEYTFHSESTVFYNLFDDEKYHMITTGLQASIAFTYGYEWNGTTWLSNASVISGFSNYWMGSPEVVYDIFGDGKWHLISGENLGEFYGFEANFTGDPDTTDPVYWGSATNESYAGHLSTFSINYNDNRALHTNGQYIFATNNTGVWVNESAVNFTSTPQLLSNVKTLNSTWGITIGYRWYAFDNVGNIADTPVYTLLIDDPLYIPPNPITLANTTGNHWVNHTFVNGSGNVTDSFNVSINDVWDNGTTNLSFNDTYSPHGWQNITVYAYNVSGTGSLSAGSVSQNTQVPNNPITITNTSDWSGIKGQTVYVDYDFTDLDSDSPTFSCNRTDLFTDFNTSTGEGSFLTTTATTYYVEFGVDDGYGSTDNYTMTITVDPAPPTPVNLANTTAGLWINHTWTNGTGDVTDSYNVSVNDVWTNGSANTFFNDTYSGHGWQNITVWAYNSTANTLSAGSISQNTQLLNNNITITNTSNWDGATGDNVYVDFDATDIDSDTPTFSCNRTDLFTDFNTTTGQGNWTSIDGVTYVNFGVSDGYGSIDNYTMSITGDLMPEDPENLGNYSENLWVNYSWTPGGEWYLFIGESDGVTLHGYNWSGSDWQSDSAVVSGITGLGSRPAPEMFYMDDTLYLIAGNYGGEFDGFKWTGTSWQSYSAIINGLTDLGRDSRPAIFQIDETWYLILGQGYGNWYGYNWTGTIWQSDSAIISGITSVEDCQAPEVFQMGNDLYLILGQVDGETEGYKWNGTGWDSYSIIASGLGDIGQLTNPSVFQMEGIWYNIAGTYAGSLYGFNWTGTTWQSDSAIVGTVGDLGEATSPGNIFMTTGNTTDSYNVSVNGVWYNGTNVSHENTYSPHTWANITIFAYNSSGSGTLSANSINQNTRVANSPITITNTSDWNGNYSENVYVDFDATDLDSDTPTFSCDRTDLFTDFNTATGQGNWTAVGGTYSVDFGVSDGWGGTDNYTMEITVTEPFVPPDPFNIANSTGDLWINHTWEILTGAGSSEWYVLDGDSSSGLSGFNWSGSAWQSDSVITGGLSSIGTYAASTTFEKNGTTYLIVGDLSTSLYGYNWTGSAWQADSAIVSGLSGPSGQPKKVDVFELEGTWCMIFETPGDGIYGFSWTGSAWESNATILDGMPGFIFCPAATIFEMDSTWYNIMAEMSGEVYGSHWTGSTWTSDSSIIAGIPQSTMWEPAPYAFEKDGIWQLVFGDSSGDLHGFNWTGSAWQADSAITGGLGSTGNDQRIINAFEIAEPAITIIDSYNISVNDVWYNGTTNQFYNETYTAHSWQNITVWAYNSSIYGALSENSISQNTQLANNPITLTDVSVSYSLNEGETFTLDANYTDLDNDTAVFTDNASDWNINSSTGEVSWLTNSSDIGTHHYRITVDDGYGSTDYQDFTVTVNDTLNILSTDPSGNFDIETDVGQQLSAVLDFTATAIWYINGEESQTDTNTTTPDYYFLSSEEGGFNVTFIATDPINGSSNSFTWFISVLESEAEPVSAAPPISSATPRPPVRPPLTIEDYVPELIEETYEQIVDAVEEIIPTDIIAMPQESLFDSFNKFTTFFFTGYNWIVLLFVYAGALLGKVITLPEDGYLEDTIFPTIIYGTVGWVLMLILNIFVPLTEISIILSAIMFFVVGLVLTVVVSLKIETPDKLTAGRK